MQPSSAESQGTDWQRTLKRFGPILAIVLVAVVVIVIVAGGGDDSGDPGAVEDPDDGGSVAESSVPETDGAETTVGDDGADPSVETTPDSTGPAPADDAPVDTGLPDGVMTISVAAELGLDIDFGRRCDTERGTLAVPNFFAPECFAPFEGDNGGATAPGVTEDSIKIVWWTARDADPVLSYVTSAILNDDTTADDEHTMHKLVEYYESYYETYGRKVDLVVYEGSGNINDVGAARADAVEIAEEHKPFMVWGGPTLTNAFAEELHARGIPCIGCGPGQTQDYYVDRPGLAYTIGKGPDQLNVLVAEYIGKRLAGDPAIHAGDESMHSKQRVFGRIWIEASAASAGLNEQFEDALADWGVQIEESQNYVLDPGTLQESASTVIARMKQAGVTSVIFNGDPIAPREFTNEATAQDYWPEWIVTGSVLVDTTAFSRTYDQQQWANAFGVSNLAARVDRVIGGVYSLYVWFHGEPPRADDNIGVINPAIQTFYSYLQLVGPDLTIENFHDAIFAAEPTRRAFTAPSISYGYDGIWPAEFEPDYRGVDDVAEIWWDPTVPGLDEIDRDGVGMWRFVNGGQRYKPGEIPEGPPAAFVLEGTVTIYEQRPDDEEFPDYYEPLQAG
ncbi:MAG: ABC transporter substrate-binding protein [Acidimicrobiaceae bacterium]|nr:ABC transporter substrate-binding protein [Acidimicrobiaceae bacterium]MYD05945.1 ABC transporter substrate-binding protein [Acidimicrobiaceae bacterium]MYI58610.1 ABC transporter substrate-binding protein [Acidimicrobiaceae bacterium]